MSQSVTDKLSPQPAYDKQLAASWTWRVVLASLLLVAAAAYSGTFEAIVDTWLRSRTYLHGFVILPISMALIWQERAVLATLPKKPYWPGIFGLLFLSVFWWISHRLGIQVGEQLAAVTILPFAVLTATGVATTSRIAFPLGYLIFAVPFGDALIPVLIDFTADFTVGALNLIGIPVLREDQFFSTPSGNFEVARACSGISYLLAALACGSLFAYLRFRSTKKRVAFILFAGLFPILANGVRALLIVLIAHFSDMRLAVGVDHILFGWFFFGIVVAIMIMVGNRFRDDPVKEAEAPLTELNPRVATSPATTTLIVLLASASLLTGPGLLRLQADSTVNLQTPWVAIPAGIAGWSGPTNLESDWYPEFINSTSESTAVFSAGGVNVQLVVIQYQSAKQNNELVNSENQIMDERAWTARTHRTLDVELQDRSLVVAEVQGRARDKGRLVWYWYDVNGRKLLSAYSVKFWEGINLLAGRESTSSFIAVSAPITMDYEITAEVLRKFLTASLKSINDCLQNGDVGPSDCVVMRDSGSNEL